VNSLISLAEMMSEYDVRHDDILSIIRPSGCTIDPVVELATRVLAERPEEVPTPPTSPIQAPSGPERGVAAHWLTPVASDEVQTAEEVIKELVGDTSIYAFGERTPGRAKLRAGDRICFYASGRGVVAHAKVSSPASKKPHPKVRHSDLYPWVFSLSDTTLYLDSPVVIDNETRTALDAFKGRDRSKSWAWFVQGTKEITEHDFKLLTRSTRGR